MVDLETWRARIGSFNLSTGGPSHGTRRIVRTSIQKWPLTVIILLTMLTNNVNPALGIGEDRTRKIVLYTCRALWVYLSVQKKLNIETGVLAVSLGGMEVH